MVFVKPVQHRLYHIFPHHRTVTRRFITTGRTISKATIRHLAIEIPWYRTFKITLSSIKCMIIHYIQHHPDASPMQSLHHLLEFLNTNRRIIRIGGIRSIRYIIVLWVISPIIFIFIQFRFIHRSIVIRRQNVNMCHTQFFQMIDAGCQFLRAKCTFFRQCQEFTFMLNAR